MAETLTAQQRIIRLVIKTLGALPEPAQRLIAGKPVQIDGQSLLTEVQMALRLLNACPDRASRSCRWRMRGRRSTPKH